MAVSTVLFSLLLSVILSYVFLTKTLHFASELLGHYLQRSSGRRRELLLARVSAEQQRFESESKRKPAKDDDEWEQVEASTVGSATNGGRADKEWSGVVGFFHPFWYVPYLEYSMS